jgi:hypothetical protein
VYTYGSDVRLMLEIRGYWGGGGGGLIHKCTKISSAGPDVKTQPAVQFDSNNKYCI